MDIYIVQISSYDNDVILGAYSTLELAEDAIDRIKHGKHINSGFYDTNGYIFISVRKLNEDHDGGSQGKIFKPEFIEKVKKNGQTSNKN